MAITPSLVFSKPNHLRYLFVATVGSGEAAQVSGAQMLADAVAGPLKAILNVKTQGYGKIAPATSLSQAQARALLCSDNGVATVGLQTAMMTCEQRTGTGTMTADAAPDGTDPTQPWITVAAPAAGAASAYVDIYFPGAIGA